MGVTCTCKSDRTIASVYAGGSLLPPQRDMSAECPVDEQALKRLEEIYSENAEKIPEVLRCYYDSVVLGKFKEVQEIVVRLGNLGEYGVRCVCRLLPFYVHVRRITLWKVGLDLDAVRLISESLVLVTGLEVLGIEGNDMKDECLLCISRSFKLMRGLKELWLSSNQFSMMGAIILSNSLLDLPKLAVLNLDFNYLRSEGCRVLCNALIPRGRMKVVSLRANEIDSKALEALVKLRNSNPPLETLNLDGNYLTEEDCATLTALYDPGTILLTNQLRLVN